MSRNERRVEIPSCTDHFGEIYRTIGEVAEGLNMSAEQRFRFAVCVSEAFTNAHLHGNRGDPAKSIRVTFSWDETQLQVDVEDEGTGKADIFGNNVVIGGVDQEKISGRGVALIRRYADNIKVTELTNGGLRVTIVWNLHNDQSADRQ